MWVIVPILVAVGLLAGSRRPATAEQRAGRDDSREVASAIARGKVPAALTRDKWGGLTPYPSDTEAPNRLWPQRRMEAREVQKEAVKLAIVAIQSGSYEAGWSALVAQALASNEPGMKPPGSNASMVGYYLAGVGLNVPMPSAPKRYADEMMRTTGLPKPPGFREVRTAKDVFGRIAAGLGAVLGVTLAPFTGGASLGATAAGLSQLLGGGGALPGKTA